MTGIEMFCECDCTQWVVMAFIVGALVGSLVIVIADYYEKKSKQTE